MKRFPTDFMYQLSEEEFESSRSHFATLKRAPTHPGGILKRLYLERLSLTISELAGTLGVSRKTLSKVVNERGDATPDMALHLSKAFNTTPELRLNLQRNYDLWEAAHEPNDWKLVEAIAV